MVNFRHLSGQILSLPLHSPEAISPFSFQLHKPKCIFLCQHHLYSLFCALKYGPIYLLSRTHHETTILLGVADTPNSAAALHVRPQLQRQDQVPDSVTQWT
jgi:hypothetical protein